MLLFCCTDCIGQISFAVILVAFPIVAHQLNIRKEHFVHLIMVAQINLYALVSFSGAECPAHKLPADDIRIAGISPAPAMQSRNIRHVYGLTTA